MENQYYCLKCKKAEPKDQARTVFVTGFYTTKDGKIPLGFCHKTTEVVRDRCGERAATA